MFSFLGQELKVFVEQACEFFFSKRQANITVKKTRHFITTLF